MSVADNGALSKLVNETIKNVARAGAAATSEFSLSDLTELTRVEPLTIISEDCKNLEYIGDICNSILNIFCGYYLQALDILNNIEHVEAIKKLNRLNPAGSGMTSSLLLALEDNSTKVNKNLKYDLMSKTNIATEDNDRNLKSLAESADLSVGKLLNISLAGKRLVTAATPDTEINDGGKVNTVSGIAAKYEDKTFNMTVSVRLMVSFLSVKGITDLITGHKEDTSFEERYHAWRSGRISLVKDLILCHDLIKEHKKSILNSENGTLTTILKRANNTKVSGVLSASPSLATASNLFIISETVASNLERELGGKLTNFTVREKAFANTYAMIIVVVDPTFDRVRFYTKGYDTYTDLGAKQLKNLSKGKGIDIMEVLKSFQTGSGSHF